MENKYYDIIVKLIKENEKFAGCEEILDTIAEDVYEHSKVVLSSVTNEDVIMAYLTKVVKTSIITVPKKLNLNTKVRPRNVQAAQAIAHTLEEIKSSTPQPLPEAKEEPLNLEEQDLFVEPEVTEQVILEDDNIIEDTPIIETVVESEEESFQEEPVIEELAPQEQDVDKNLVDKMINGIPEKEEEANIEAALEEAEELTISDSIEELSLEEIQEEPALHIDEPALRTEEPEQIVLQEEENSFELQEEPSVDFDIAPVLDSFETEDEDTILLEETALEEVNEENLLTEEEVTEDNDLLFEEPIDSVEEITEISAELPSYECFSFEPSSAEFSADEICSVLEDFDSRHPEKNLLEICKLKYEQKLSVSDIANNLGMTNEDVLEVLSEIIELVKD